MKSGQEGRYRPFSFLSRSHAAQAARQHHRGRHTAAPHGGAFWRLYKQAGQLPPFRCSPPRNRPPAAGCSTNPLTRHVAIPSAHKLPPDAAHPALTQPAVSKSKYRCSRLPHRGVRCAHKTGTAPARLIRPSVKPTKYSMGFLTEQDRPCKQKGRPSPRRGRHQRARDRVTPKTLSSLKCPGHRSRGEGLAVLRRRAPSDRKGCRRAARCRAHHLTRGGHPAPALWLSLL